MKVLFIIDRLGSGGKERQLVELLKGLRSFGGITCQLIVLSKDIHYSELLDLGIETHKIERNGKFDLRVLKMVYQIGRAFEPDLIHSWESMASFYALPTSKRLKVKLINSIIRNAPSRLSWFTQEWLRTRFLLKFSDLILANSQAGLESYKIPRQKSYCIYNGFDFKRIEGLEKEAGVRARFNINKPFVIGMVGKFTDKKDYKTFLLAASRILEKRNDIDFVTIGDGKNLKLCQESVDSSNIHFLGNQKNVESIINIFTIGVLTTYTEGISNAIMEYMALGKPVIATDGGGTCELLIDGETGYLVNQQDVEDLVKRMELLLNDRDLAQNMGRAGKQRLLNEFNLQKMIEQMRELYHKTALH